MIVDTPMDLERRAVVRICYTNYRGETTIREIVPKAIHFGSTEWHPDAQWILTAYDVAKQADRGFAIRDIRAWLVE